MRVTSRRSANSSKSAAIKIAEAKVRIAQRNLKKLRESESLDKFADVAENVLIDIYEAASENQEYGITDPVLAFRKALAEESECFEDNPLALEFIDYIKAHCNTIRDFRDLANKFGVTDWATDEDRRDFFDDDEYEVYLDSRLHEAEDPRALSNKAGSVSYLVKKHLSQTSPEFLQLQKMPKARANEELKNIVANFVNETDSPAVIKYITNEVLPKMEKQNFDRNLIYLWSGITMKGDGYSMNKKRGSWY